MTERKGERAFDAIRTEKLGPSFGLGAVGVILSSQSDTAMSCPTGPK